jgi:hypothetical protein
VASAPAHVVQCSGKMNMTSSLTCIIAVAIVMVSCARHADAQGTEATEGVEPCASPLPALQIEKVLEPIVREMCQRSPTFRRQMIRIADAPGLVVTVARRRVRTSSGAEAVTRFERADRLLRRADVEIGPADQASLVELIAHELEHVLEQLDDVNLTYMAQGPGVRSYPSERGPAFDTARARQIGLDVAAEFNAGSVATRQGQGGPR